MSTRPYDRSFALAFVSQAIFALANMLLAHYARWIGFLGGSTDDVGWIIGIGSVAGLVLRPWMAQFIDRVGNKASWALGYGIFGAGTIGSLWLHDLNWSVYVYRSCLVLGPALVFANSITYITKIFPDTRRTEAIGVMGASGLAAMLVGPYIGDVILGLGSEPRTREDFTTLFLTAIVLMVVPFGCLFLIRVPDTRNRQTRLRLTDFVQTVRRYWPGGVLVVNVIHGLYMSVPFAFLPRFIDDAKISIPGSSELGTFFIAYAGLALVLRVLTRRVPDRRGRRKVLLVGLCFCGTAAFSLLLVDSSRPWLLIVAGLAGGAGHALSFPPLTSLCLERFPAEARGSGAALSFLMVDVGTIGGAPLLGLLAENYGWHAMFIAAGSACFLSASYYFSLSVPVWHERARRRRLGLANEPSHEVAPRTKHYGLPVAKSSSEDAAKIH